MNVVDIESATLFERNVAAAGDLREASEARFDSEEEGTVAVAFELTREKGARANKGNVAL